VWDNYPGEPATPQVLILKRQYDFNGKAEENTSPMGIKKEALLIRLIGADLIRNFDIESLESFNY